MKNLLIALTLLMSSSIVLAAEGGVKLDSMQPNLHDKTSLQRGATLFTNYCMACHSLKYARYERIAKDLDIPKDIYKKNLIFNNDKIGSLMTIAMTENEGTKFFGKAPPDLTSEAGVRGPDWLYTFLRAFYADPSRPTGMNNAVYKKVAMPFVLADLQGVCAKKPKFGIPTKVDPLSGSIVKQSGCDDYLRKGSLTTAQYNQDVYDLVNFLVYMEKPYELKSQRIGTYVLIFLAFLFVLVWLLNKEYWKDIHRD